MTQHHYTRKKVSHMTNRHMTNPLAFSETKEKKKEKAGNHRLANDVRMGGGEWSCGVLSKCGKHPLHPINRPQR